tara:strand:+ start:749 stop:1801 length:1053 start_codon:yes stop_codon:yes gene_type:complete
MKELYIEENNSLKDALVLMDELKKKCLIVTNGKSKFLGTLSDGDIRRSILKKIPLSQNIKGIYNNNPTVFLENHYSFDNAKEVFLKERFDFIPIINDKKNITNIIFWEQIFSKDEKKLHNFDVKVVIMAGGKGTRLHPVTKVLPKPLIPVNEKPIIEHIIEKFYNSGCNEFSLTVNYKSSLIKAYFDELKPPYKIKFIDEKIPLGTAGSLKFLPNEFKQPFIVSNCDTIVSIDYSSLYEFHKKNKFSITLVASLKNYTIPYGTCVLNDEEYLKELNEKPNYDLLVNVGLYILEPVILDYIPNGKIFHITDLIDQLIKNDFKVGVYPIDEKDWIDIGEWSEYQKAVKVLTS